MVHKVIEVGRHDKLTVNLAETLGDLLLGIGGTPEGIITACAIKCIGGVIQGRLAPKDDEEKQRALDAGHDVNRVLTTNDLVRGENIFFCATGVTDGDLQIAGAYAPGEVEAVHAATLEKVHAQQAVEVDQADGLDLGADGDVAARELAANGGG